MYIGACDAILTESDTIQMKAGGRLPQGLARCVIRWMNETQGSRRQKGGEAGIMQSVRVEFIS